MHLVSWKSVGLRNTTEQASGLRWATCGVFTPNLPTREQLNEIQAKLLSLEFRVLQDEIQERRGGGRIEEEMWENVRRPKGWRTGQMDELVSLETHARLKRQGWRTCACVSSTYRSSTNTNHAGHLICFDHY